MVRGSFWSFGVTKRGLKVAFNKSAVLFSDEGHLGHCFQRFSMLLTK